MNHEWFEVFVAVIILGASIGMCFEVQYNGLQLGYELQYAGCNDSAKHVWPHALGLFNFIDVFFGSLFILEAITKMFCFGCKYFCDSSNIRTTEIRDYWEEKVKEGFGFDCKKITFHKSSIVEVQFNKSDCPKIGIR